MPATVPASHVDLLSGPYYAVLTTVAPSGQPENTVVWCSWDGSHVLVNTALGRRKHNNVLANPRVALTVIDPKDPFRWIDVRGTVEAIEEDKEYANINAHAKLYVGGGSVLRRVCAGGEARDGGAADLEDPAGSGAGVPRVEGGVWPKGIGRDSIGRRGAPAADFDCGLETCRHRHPCRHLSAGEHSLNSANGCVSRISPA